MVKKYSPTIDKSEKPAMKVDGDGHFVHRDDYFKVKKFVEDFAEDFLNAEPTVVLYTLDQLKQKTREFLDKLEAN